MDNDSKKTDGTKITLPAFGLAEDILGKIAGAPAQQEQSEEVSQAVTREKISEDIKKTVTSSVKYVSFFLAAEEYALPISQVQEINRVVEITRVPNSPEHVLGVINLRGKIIPVLELNKRLKLSETKIEKNSRIVVVEYGSKILGLLVDRVSQVLNIDASKVETTPDDAVIAHANFVKGIGKIEDRMIMLLDLDKVIGDRIGKN